MSFGLGWDPPTFGVITPRATTALCGSTREASPEFCEGEREMAGKKHKQRRHQDNVLKQKVKFIKLRNKQERI